MNTIAVASISKKEQKNRILKVQIINLGKVPSLPGEPPSKGKKAMAVVL